MNDFVIHYYSTESKDFLAICLGNYSFTDRYCEKKIWQMQTRKTLRAPVASFHYYTKL